jgi:hypothetical protein
LYVFHLKTYRIDSISVGKKTHFLIELCSMIAGFLSTFNCCADSKYSQTLTFDNSDKRNLSSNKLGSSPEHSTVTSVGLFFDWIKQF